VVATADRASHQFTFDRVFGTNSEQDEVWRYAGLPAVEAVVSGYNAAIIAYGQTGAGKTHTMMGPNGSVDVDAPDQGIVPRAVRALFTHMLNADEGLEFSVVVNYVEIYQEKIRDLLDVSRDDLKIGELYPAGAGAGAGSGGGGPGGPGSSSSSSSGVYVKDVTAFSVVSEDEVFEIMRQGAANRATAATGMNAGSSRSHSLFVLAFSQEDTRTGTRTTGKLNLVDLAGSETVSKTGVSGVQLEELKRINKSLSALGGVINALTDSKTSHVPYRDSKLTHLLKDSLGGNSKTALIINCSPSAWNEMETLSTLRFGKRAKRIKNKPLVNLERGPEELKRLVGVLEARIAAYARREKDWLSAYRSPHFPAGLARLLVDVVTAAERDQALADVAGPAGMAAAPGDPAPPTTPPVAAVVAAAPAPTAAAAPVAPPPVPTPAKRAPSTPKAAVYIGGDEDEDEEEVGAAGEGAGEGAGGSAAAAAAATTAEGNDAGAEEGSWDENYEDLAAARDELESQNKAMLDLLKQAGSELKNLRKVLETRDGRVSELQGKLEAAQRAADEAAAKASAATAAAAVAAAPPSGAEEVRTLRENYHLALDENEELRGEVDELRVRVAEAEAELTARTTTRAEREAAGVAELPTSSSSSSFAPALVEEEVWENQRLHPTMGWTHALLPPPADPDGGAWSDASGITVRTREGVSLPPENDGGSGVGWYWVGAWGVDADAGAGVGAEAAALQAGGPRTDRDGWRYGSDFGDLGSGGGGSTTSSSSSSRPLARGECGKTDAVRRRRWVRVRASVPLLLPVGGPSEAAGAASAPAGAPQAGSVAPLLRRVHAQDEQLARLAADSARKGEVIAEYEERLQSISRQVAEAAATGDLRLLGAVAAGGRLVSGASGGTAPVRIRGGAGRAGGPMSLSPGGAAGFPAGSGGPDGFVPDRAAHNGAGAGGGDGGGVGGAGAAGPGTPGGAAGGAGGAGGGGFFRSLLKRLSTSPSKAGAPPGFYPGSPGFGGGGGRPSMAVPGEAGSGEDGSGDGRGGLRGQTNGLGSTSSGADSASTQARAAVLASFFKACEDGDLAHVREALASGVVPGPTVTDRSGRTGLLYAGRGGQLPVIQFLVKAGCPLLSSDKDARNALAYAARRGHVEVASWLLAQGLPVTSCDVHGLTPLHQAILGRHTAASELLLKAGADLRARDSNGNTPYRLAKKFLTEDSPDSKSVLLCLQKWMRAMSKDEQEAAGRDSSSVTSVGGGKGGRG
jgi:hypothetical protein